MNKNNQRAHAMELKAKADAIMNSAKSENRGYSEAEVSELRNINAELTGMSISNTADSFKEERNANLDFAQACVEAANNRRQITLSSADGFVGVGVGDIIGPLEKGMILDKVGCKIQTGLDKEWKYPVVSAIEATVAGETASVADTTLSLSKVAPTPQRVSLSSPVTNTALSVSNENLKDIVMNQVALGAIRVLNKWMFKDSAIVTGVNGPFVSPGTTASMATAAHPTYAEIIGLKAAVDADGVIADNSAAYVMNAAMKAYCEATPKNNTVGCGMICENGKINGVPVFVTEYAPANKIEFAYFSYALVGQFGDANIVVDPFTLAGSNQVRFILNTNWDIKAARAEAFGILA